MIAVDANILVRYFVQDDSRQFALAKTFIEERLSRETPGFVTLVAIAELGWVLERLYGQSPSAIVAVVNKLLNSAQIVVEEASAVEAALSLPHDEMADALIHEAGRAKGCQSTITFDRKFARLEGVELLA